MDRLVARFDAVRDGDLMLCEHRGVAYQADMKARRVEYDDTYLAKVQAYEGGEIARAVNAGRVALLQRHLPPAATVLDIGAGSGAFMRAARAAGFDCKGFDVISSVVSALGELYAEDPEPFDALTFWDSIEHMDAPEAMLKSLQRERHAFVSLPIFEDLRAVRASKHYRPGEHLYYWTAQGFVGWMEAHGFRLLEASRHEVDAGREQIGAFAFKRDAPDYHAHVLAYREMHSTRFYGSSATELYLDQVGAVVRELNPTSILDYGCGRSDLVAHFWRDGKRRIARYDPAIPQFKAMPTGTFDLVLCCDVLEHIPLASIDRVLAEVRGKGARALLTISTKPSRAKLPDGRNAHVTLLSNAEWTRWVTSYFGKVRALPSKWEHEMVLAAGF